MYIRSEKSQKMEGQKKPSKSLRKVDQSTTREVVYTWTEKNKMYERVQTSDIVRAQPDDRLAKQLH